MLVLVLLGGSAGVTWDRVWHATEPFDGFWSPPHVVVYVTVALASFMAMALLFRDRYRRAFGQGFSVGVLPFRVPGGLFILLAALGLLGFAGAVLDNLWHSAFGLNETGWSFPHAMLGTGLFLLACGFLAARQGMNDKPVPASTKVMLGFLIVWLAFGVFTGPPGGNRTPESLGFFFTYIPALASQDSAQQVYRIYDAYNLTRTNPLFFVLASIWLGAALAFLRRLDQRASITLLVMLLLVVFDYGNRDFGETFAQFVPGLGDQANWEAVPVLLPACLYLLLARWRENWALGAAAVLFGVMCVNIWGERQSAQWLLALVLPAFALAGAWLGRRCHDILRAPHTFQQVLPLLVFAAGLPLLTGIVDLALRASLG
jgi:hypothetical protein